MSHFALLVVTDAEPTDDILAATLQPWHEFECTGVDDQYVVDVDRTDEAREQYAAATSRVFVAPDGVEYSAYLDRFYREPTPSELTEIGPIGGTVGSRTGFSFHSKDWGDGRGYRAKVHACPAGWRDAEVPQSTHETLAAWCEGYYGLKPLLHDERPDLRKTHKYGYVRLDARGEVVKVVDRTNPNKRWDWWVIGGRYENRLILKLHMNGACNHGRVGDIDWDAMRVAHSVRRRHAIDEALRRHNEDVGKGWYRYKGMGPLTYEVAVSTWDACAAVIGDVMAAWNAQPEGPDKIVSLRDFFKARLHAEHPVRRCVDTGVFEVMAGLIGAGVPEQCADVQRWIDAAPPLTCWAYLRDGKWRESGKMGWFAMSSDDKPYDAWEAETADMLGSLRPDQWLTVVDCHI